MGIFRPWRNGEFTFFQRCLQPLYFSRSPPPTQSSFALGSSSLMFNNWIKIQENRELWTVCILKIEEYSWIFPSFRHGIFGHVTCLDQSALLQLHMKILREVQHKYRPSDRVQKKWKSMRKRCQSMGKFLKLIKLYVFPWHFFNVKIHFNVLPRSLVLYDMLGLLLPFMDRYFFIQRSFSNSFVVEFLQSLVTRH